VESLERVEAAIRLLRQRLVDQAEATNARSARDDLARFDEGLGDLPTALVVQGPSGTGRNARHVLFAVGLSVVGAVGGAFVGAITCHEQESPEELNVSPPCAGAAVAGLLIGLGAGLVAGLLTVWLLRKRRAGRSTVAGRR
jgi:membrane associated rhomboid family serine protease